MHEPHWGLLIAIYLFCGGLSAGAMMLSTVACLFGRAERDAAIARLGALVSPLPVIAGTALLVVDLGRPFFFWKLFTAVAPLSPMWIGSWLLAIFSVLSLLYAYLHAPIAWQRWMPADLAGWRRRLAIAGLPLGAAVAVYTAILLGVLVARPLWNTPLLSLLFLVSALSSAAALLVLLLPDGEHLRLARADIALIACELVLIGALLLFGSTSNASTHEAIRVLAGQGFGGLFWLGVVLAGLLVPLGVELSLVRPAFASHGLAALAAVCVLAGGFLLRYVIVYAGQQSALL
ncbi:MAG TPA: NrfD/PsrC family molybdoenzyme membrane anchor subunit [Vicinamibacterales bacterium]|nr:NrfD/PsrC family molybdoenzyme membrane anchor subunit [Vicinamibacterales bacterium]